MVKSFVLSSLFLIIPFAAESRTISGTITDGKQHLPIEGATVAFKGSKVLTDASGRYSFTAPVSDGDTILAYKHRYQYKQAILSGNAQTYDASLDPAVYSREFAPPLRVLGGMIYNANNQPVCLQGVAIHEPNNLKESDFVNWSQNWKINAVRMIMHSHEKNKLEDGYLKAADNALNWAKKYKIYVVLDGFHEAGCSGDVEHHWNRVQEVWRILMPRLKDYDHLIWEIYNEPYGNGGDKWEVWVPKAKLLVDLIRSYNPVVKACVVPGVFWAQFIEFKKATLDREQIIYSFHPYFGTFWNAPHTAASWDKAMGYIQKEDIGPIFCGEWAAKGNGGDTANQIDTYFRPILRYFNNNKIHFTHWGYFPSWGGEANLTANSLGQPEKLTTWGKLLIDYFNGKPWDPLQPVAPGKKEAGQSFDTQKYSFHISQSGNTFAVHHPAGLHAGRINIYTIEGGLIGRYGIGPSQTLTRTKTMTQGCYIVEITGGRFMSRNAVILGGKR